MQKSRSGSGLNKYRTVSHPVSATFYFHIFKQTLTLQTWNTYKWKDSRLAWTPTDWNNITTLKFSRHDTIWVPDVFVFKIVDEVKQFGDFQYIVSSDGSVLYIPIEIHKVKKKIIIQIV